MHRNVDEGFIVIEGYGPMHLILKHMFIDIYLLCNVLYHVVCTVNVTL